MLVACNGWKVRDTVIAWVGHGAWGMVCVDDIYNGLKLFILENS